MFKRLNQHIYISILGITAILITIMIAVCVFMVGNMMTTYYVNMANLKIESSVTRNQNYINSILTNSNNVANNQEIIDEILSPSGKTFTSMLNNFCNYAMSTDAITIYTTDGRIYSSSGISDIPSLTELQNDTELQEFFAGSKKDTILIRTEHIPSVYNNQSYSKENGIFSCCTKIEYDNKVIGYAIADILAQNVYSFFDWSNDDYFNTSIPIIKYEDSYLPYKNNYNYLNDFKNANQSQVRTFDGAYLIVPYNSEFYGGELSVAIPLASLYTNITLMTITLSAIGIFLVFLVHLISTMLSNNVDKRLSRLYMRMNKEGYKL